VPGVHAQGEHDATAFLVLDWFGFGSEPLGAALGTALARLHGTPAGTRYGWGSDNFIGGTPQVNGWNDDWTTFFCERRLRPQLTRAGLDCEPVLAAAAARLRGHAPTPSLLHGDLWAGNAGMLADGIPALFDPAVYIGDRETDLAMTQLFGGFDASFYRAYHAAWALPVGHEARRDVYALYHVLNHLNLFGTSYLAQAQRLIARIAT
jgi:fructosamine-3-kinase